MKDVSHSVYHSSGMLSLGQSFKDLNLRIHLNFRNRGD